MYGTHVKCSYRAGRENQYPGTSLYKGIDHKKRRQKMTRTADKIVIHSDDVLEVATSVGGSGARVSAGALSSIINKRLVFCSEAV